VGTIDDIEHRIQTLQAEIDELKAKKQAMMAL